MLVTPAEIAQTLGITVSQLGQDGQAGKTIADIAGAQGLDASAFLGKLTAIVQAALTARVQARTMTSSQETQALALLKQRAQGIWHSTPGRPPVPAAPAPLAGPKGAPAPGPLVTPAEIAQTLGITVSQLGQDGQAGKTIADIAGVQGLDASAFLGKLTAVVQAALTARVQAGTMTSTQETQALARLKQRAQGIWDSTPGGPPLPGARRPLGGGAPPAGGLGAGQGAGNSGA